MSALFDFDGTLLPDRNNLTWHLVRASPDRRWRAVKTAVFTQAMSGLIPAVIGRVVDVHQMHKLLLAATFSGLPVDLVTRAGEQVADVIDRGVYPEMEHVLAQHQSDAGYLVSCNTEPIVSTWSRRRSLTCVATRLHQAGGRYTGLVEGELNRGPEKVRRVTEAGVDLAAATAYGNSLDDEPLLRAAGEAVLVDPDAALDARWPFAEDERIPIGERS